MFSHNSIEWIDPTTAVKVALRTFNLCLYVTDLTHIFSEKSNCKQVSLFVRRFTTTKSCKCFYSCWEWPLVGRWIFNCFDETRVLLGAGQLVQHCSSGVNEIKADENSTCNQRYLSLYLLFIPNYIKLDLQTWNFSLCV